MRVWRLLKKILFILMSLIVIGLVFLFLTPSGTNIREKLAETVIMTQHRNWAWIFVGVAKRDQMIADKINSGEVRGATPLDPTMINIHKANRKEGALIKVEDISGPRWKGKKIYVYDPTAIRVVVPAKSGAGETISSMVERTGAVAGINGGGFDDPSGLGNGFAPIGFIMSGGTLLYTGLNSYVPQHVVGFTDKGLMIVGKYSINDLVKQHIREAVTFDPRIIANRVPLITKGDGGSGIQPRTAVGQKADGTVIFIVIDGRQFPYSIGATEREVQDLFIQDDVVNAGFLDGGASSELVVRGEGVVTRPSSRFGERRLPTGFLIFDNPNNYKATKVWDGITTIDPGGAYDNPAYLKEQADLKKKRNLKKTKPSPTNTSKELNTSAASK
jgi:exopolysaccharide biosynthesis protein